MASAAQIQTHHEVPPKCSWHLLFLHPHPNVISYSEHPSTIVHAVPLSSLQASWIPFPFLAAHLWDSVKELSAEHLHLSFHLQANTAPLAWCHLAIVIPPPTQAAWCIGISWSCQTLLIGRTVRGKYSKFPICSQPYHEAYSQVDLRST